MDTAALLTVGCALWFPGHKKKHPTPHRRDGGRKDLESRIAFFFTHIPDGLFCKPCRQSCGWNVSAEIKAVPWAANCINILYANRKMKTSPIREFYSKYSGISVLMSWSALCRRPLGAHKSNILQNWLPRNRKRDARCSTDPGGEMDRMAGSYILVIFQLLSPHYNPKTVY